MWTFRDLTVKRPYESDGDGLTLDVERFREQDLRGYRTRRPTAAFDVPRRNEQRTDGRPDRGVLR